MKTTTEMEIKITGGRIVNITLSEDGVCKLNVEVEAKQESEAKAEDNTKAKAREKEWWRGTFPFDPAEQWC